MKAVRTPDEEDAMPGMTDVVKQFLDAQFSRDVAKIDALADLMTEDCSQQIER